MIPLPASIAPGSRKRRLEARARRWSLLKRIVTRGICTLFSPALVLLTAADYLTHKGAWLRTLASVAVIVVVGIVMPRLWRRRERLQKHADRRIGKR